LDSHDADALRRRVAIEFSEHQTQHGTRPGEWSRWVQRVLDPVVPWQQILAAAVRRGIGWTHGHTDYTYTKISRRQAGAGRIVLPALRRPVPEVAVVVDTSGSIDDGLLSQALGEVDGILTAQAIPDGSVTVLAVDAAVHHVERVRAARDVKLGGGGGTDMGIGITAALALKPRPSVVIVLTDGYTPWPSVVPPAAVIVVLIGRARSDLPPTPEWAQRIECVP
jgi:predicted metal-dependent peptidase